MITHDNTVYTCSVIHESKVPHRLSILLPKFGRFWEVSATFLQHTRSLVARPGAVSSVRVRRRRAKKAGKQLRADSVAPSWAEYVDSWLNPPHLGWETPIKSRHERMLGGSNALQ